MDLTDLGWNEFFSRQLEELDLDDILIGRVSRVDLNSFEVLTCENEIESRLSGRLRNNNNIPGVGDWVLIRTMETGNMIFHVLDRISRISRKTPGKGSTEQLVASNLDLIFIVMGLDDDYNPRRLERYLTMISGSGALPVVILNKMDIADDIDERSGEIREICGEIPLHLISALTDDGTDVIREYLRKGVTIAMIGSSGAGKSTLINSLIGENVRKTGAVRSKDGKGRHVTTSRELIMIPGGGMIIDNPGIREIQLWGNESSIEEAFKDIKELASICRFKDCRHISEPGCEVTKAVDDGRLDEKRYNNYIKMRLELENLEMRSSKSSEAAERDKWKPIMKGMRHYFKYKKTRS